MKQLNHCPVRFGLLSFLVCSSFVFGQDASQAGNKKPRIRDEYQPRTLKEITAIKPAAEIKFVEMHFRKPPLVELIFDVVLRNDRARPRWFLLPSHVYPDNPGIPEKGGVDALEVFAPHSKGRVIIGHFLGTGGFQALLLPPGAEIRLRRFPISYWGELPAKLEIEIVIARRLTIGGEAAESWFGKNPMSSVKADISEEAENTMRISHTRRTPGSKEVSPAIAADRRFQIQVLLDQKE